MTQQKTALLVIDMLNDFARKGGALYSPRIEAIIPQVARELEAARGRQDLVFHITDYHLPVEEEFKKFGPHAVRGTEGAHIIAELAPLFNEKVVQKRFYSGFYDTDLDYLLKSQGVERLRVVGDCTNICVLYTVADARNRGYAVEVVRDAVDSFDPAAHEFALAQMDHVLGAVLV